VTSAFSSLRLSHPARSKHTLIPHVFRNSSEIDIRILLFVYRSCCPPPPPGLSDRFLFVTCVRSRLDAHEPIRCAIVNSKVQVTYSVSTKRIRMCGVSTRRKFGVYKLTASKEGSPYARQRIAILDQTADFRT
jgi:hypothetical protein